MDNPLPIERKNTDMFTLKLKSLYFLRTTLAIAGAILTTSLSTTVAKGEIEPGADSQRSHSIAASSISQIFDTRFCARDLDRTLDEIISRPEFDSANWGVLVYPLSAAQTIYAHNADQLLIPASNIKLLTTATAMRIFALHDPQLLWEFRDELYIINRHSDNALADALLQKIGGQGRVHRELAPLGIRTNGFIQADGSGLSRENKATPLTFVTLLKGMYETDSTGMFYDSLPVGGINGTLRNRFRDTAVEGKVHAKTGTLNGVRALSGYLETDTYGTIVFSIVVNQPGQYGGVMLDAIDEMVLTMSNVEPCH